MNARKQIIKHITTINPRAGLFIATLMLGVAPIWAQAPVPVPEVDHSKMDHGGTPPATQAAGGDADKDAGKMDHGAMQGGDAPPDARDPHAYSGGYVFGPDRELRMADEHYFHSILVNRLEAARTRDRTTGQYDLLARFGRDYDRAVLKSEGEVYGGRIEEARTELLWGHAVAAYWDMQLGVRYDSGVGRDRGWLAFGVQGLAPYWFEIDATAYVGNEGRTALRLEAEYELLLTQKLILQPRIEANLYGKRDVERGIGSGLADLSLGLRLRYENSTRVRSLRRNRTRQQVRGNGGLCTGGRR